MQYLIIIFLCLFSFQCVTQTNNTTMNFTNNEITIPFPDSYSEQEDKTFYSMTNDNYKSGYFLEAAKKIRFHEDKQQKYYEDEEGNIIPTQHVISSDNYLSSLYIYPKIDIEDALLEVKNAFQPTDDFVSYRNVEKKKFGQLTVLNWRMQRGKSRLEHYLLIGKEMNYLFISTPYGETEYIESILEKIDLKD